VTEETYPNGRPVAPLASNKRLDRDRSGNSLAVPDKDGIPRYLYTDGTMDLNSTVNLEIARVVIPKQVEVGPITERKRLEIHQAVRQGAADLPANELHAHLGNIGMAVAEAA
jgi:hypothetical protein